jgi:hypothetical protein
MGASEKSQSAGAFDDVEERSAQRRTVAARTKQPSGESHVSGRDPSSRQSAIAFLEGTRQGWDLHDIVTWSDLHLVRPGRLLTHHVFPRILIREHGLGVLSYGAPSRGEAPAGFLAHSNAGRLVAQARSTVMSKLEGLLRAIPDDSFVQAAIYDGRVSRGVLRDGSRGWQVLVTERHALSDQVLALIAADLLDHRHEYEHDLVVCDACATVAFWPERMSRRGCPDHPVARIGSGSAQTGSLRR